MLNSNYITPKIYNFSFLFFPFLRIITVYEKVKLKKNKHRLCVLIDENSYTELHRVCNTNVKTHIITYRYKCLNTNNCFPSLTYTHHFFPTLLILSEVRTFYYILFFNWSISIFKSIASSI